MLQLGSDRLKNLKGKSVLVTGATGFIGLNLVRRLSKIGVRVHAMARKNARPAAIKFFKEQFRVNRPIVCDPVGITDLNAVKKLVHKVRPDVVFHLASEADTSLSYPTALRSFETNVKGTMTLLESLRGTSLRSFVFTSSTEVYGKIAVPFRENFSPEPPSPYGISKIAAEQICQYYYRTHGIPAVILRMSVCYGPHQRNSRLISSIFHACLSGGSKEKLRLTSGRQSRDFLFVDDAVDGILNASVAKQAIGEVINLAGNRTVSLKEMVGAISDLCGSKPKIQWRGVPDPQNVNPVWKTDISKAIRILKWRPKTDLKSGLIKTLPLTMTSK